MSKIYLAARYSLHPELQEYARQLSYDGHTITSRWIWGSHQIDDSNLADANDVPEKIKFALEDREDLEMADTILSFTEPPRSSASRGGRHVEYGMALALNKQCMVVGPRENIFHWLPEVAVFDTFDQARKALKM